MRKRIALAVCAGFLFGSAVVSAQATKGASSQATVTDLEVDLMRRDLRDQKKQLVAANMTLTGDEATKFWPVYDAYTAETVKLNDQRLAVIKEYAQAYNTMTAAMLGQAFWRSERPSMPS